MPSFLQSDVEIRQMIRTAMCAENGGVGESTERPAVRGGSSSSGSFFGGLFRSQSVREHRNYGGPVPESPLFNQLRKNMLHQRHQKAFMGSRQSVDLGRIEAGNSSPLLPSYRFRTVECVCV